MNIVEDQTSERGKPKWFVIRTNQRQEKLAASALRAEHIETYLPITLRETRKGEVRADPLFPSYAFVHLPMACDSWRLVFTARGVNSVVSWGGRIRPIADQVIERIKREERDGYVKLSLEAPPVHEFKKGQLVTFEKGPFAALPAIFQEAIDTRRCMVLLSLIGETERLAKAEIAHIAA
jgi:transcription elongation factor/antiterminator RfaH